MPVIRVVARALHRLSAWDADLKHYADPWTPRSLVFWWLWRPFAFTVVLTAVWVPMWVAWELTASPLAVVVAGWLAIWFFTWIERQG